MPMGIVSDADFKKESEKLTTPPPTKSPNPPNKVLEGEVVDMKRGRGKGSVEVPNGLRNLIGVTALNESRGDALELASAFNISPSSASAYGVGATSTKTYDERPNSPVIDKTKEKIQIKAKRKLMLALNSLTSDKISESKAKDIAGIAKDMSAIVRNMEPEKVNESNNGDNGKQPFVVFSPMVHSENHYEVIVVKE